MKFKAIYKILLVFLISLEFCCYAIKSCLEPSCVKPVLDDQGHFTNWSNCFNNYAQDFIDVNRRVFTSLDTLKICTGVLPLYLITRYVDDDLHSGFYNAGVHKNFSQLPNWVQTLTSKAVPAITATFAFFPFFNGIHENVRHTSSVMAMGALSLSGLRNIIKYSLRSRTAFRPWHGSFSDSCRAIGGFPSGHMAMATYLASLYGLRHGPKWGFPLTVFASFVFAASLSGNRHYASQLVGGFGLGFIYGFASYKLLETRYGKNINISLDIDAKNRTNIGLSCEF